ncbi:hypothetical protein [Gimesia maris]|uniref:hypothetical protein n=1 Tax=Gimesia maris TaxID=122 RepID=UPI0032EB75DF
MQFAVVIDNRKLSEHDCRLERRYRPLLNPLLLFSSIFEDHTVSFLLAALGPNFIRAHPTLYHKQHHSERNGASHRYFLQARSKYRQLAPYRTVLSFRDLVPAYCHSERKYFASTAV